MDKLSFPFKGSVGVGMGTVRRVSPIPLLSSPLKGEGLGATITGHYREV